MSGDEQGCLWVGIIAVGICIWLAFGDGVPGGWRVVGVLGLLITVVVVALVFIAQQVATPLAALARMAAIITAPARMTPARMTPIPMSADGRDVTPAKRLCTATMRPPSVRLRMRSVMGRI